MKNIWFLLFISVSFLNAQTIIDGEWEEVPKTVRGDNFERIFSTSNGTLFSQNGGSINYLSEDKGNTWQKVDFLVTEVAMDGTIFKNEKSIHPVDSVTYNVFSYTQDNGRTWSQVEYPDSVFSRIIPLASGDWIGTQIKTRGNSWWRYAHYYLSEDQGATWELQSYVNIDYPSIQNPIIYEVADGVIIRRPGSLGNMWISTNQCQSFENTNARLEWSWKLPTMERGKDSTLYATFSNRFLRSTDNGITWERFSARPDFLSGAYFLESLVQLETGEIILQQRTESYPSCQKTWDTYITEDDGANWRQIELPFDLKLHPAKIDGEILGTNHEIYRTSQSDLDNWELSTIGVDSNAVMPTRAISKDTLFSRFGNKHIVSLNGGETWEPFFQDSFCTIYSDHFFSNLVNGNLIFATGSEIYLTKDFGNSFKNITPPGYDDFKSNSYAVISEISPDGDFLVSNGSGAYVSSDEGSSWLKVSDEYFNNPRFNKSFWVAQFDRNNVAGKRLHLSTDRGIAWHILPNLGFGYDFDITEQNEIIYESDNKIWVAEDNGTTINPEPIMELQGRDNRFRQIELDQAGSLVYYFTGQDNFPKIGMLTAADYTNLRFPNVDPTLMVDSTKFSIQKFFISPEGYLYISTYQNQVFRFNRPTFEFANVSPVADIEQENRATIFPNPTQKQITLSLSGNLKSEANFLLFNQLGQQVLEKRLPKNQSTFHIQWEHLPKGIYFYSIGKEGVGGKLVIE